MLMIILSNKLNNTFSFQQNLSELQELGLDNNRRGADNTETNVPRCSFTTYSLEERPTGRKSAHADVCMRCRATGIFTAAGSNRPGRMGFLLKVEKGCRREDGAAE